MLRRIVKSQARRFVPSTKDSILLHALTKVSCTRSSARSRLPHKDTAKARKFGTTARRSAVIWELTGCSPCPSPGTPESTGFVGAAFTCRPSSAGRLRSFQAASVIQENVLAQAARECHRTHCEDATQFDQRSPAFPPPCRDMERHAAPWVSRALPLPPRRSLSQRSSFVPPEPMGYSS